MRPAMPRNPCQVGMQLGSAALTRSRGELVGDHVGGTLACGFDGGDGRIDAGCDGRAGTGVPVACRSECTPWRGTAPQGFAPSATSSPHASPLASTATPPPCSQAMAELREALRRLAKFLGHNFDSSTAIQEWGSLGPVADDRHVHVYVYVSEQSESHQLMLQVRPPSWDSVTVQLYQAPLMGKGVLRGAAAMGGQALLRALRSTTPPTKWDKDTVKVCVKHAVDQPPAPVVPKPLSKASSSSAAPVGRATHGSRSLCSEILQPATKFQRKGQTYEIHCHDSMQSTSARQYYYLKLDGRLLGSSYERDSHWIVAEQPTSPMEEDLLGFVSNVMDWRMINIWDDEKACRQRN